MKWVRVEDRIKILAAWNEGLCVDDIVSTTGCSRDLINGLLPVKEIEEYERKEVLESYGYTVSGS